VLHGHDARVRWAGNLEFCHQTGSGLSKGLNGLRFSMLWVELIASVVGEAMSHLDCQGQRLTNTSYIVGYNSSSNLRPSQLIRTSGK
jgi:hypothetical protein